jgi:hypothetical protein
MIQWKDDDAINEMLLISKQQKLSAKPTAFYFEIN